MSTTDPWRRWDGRQWWRWDGQTWAPEGSDSGPQVAWSRPEAPTAEAPTPAAPGYHPTGPTYSPPVPAYHPQAPAPYIVPSVVVTDQRDRSGMAIVAWIFTVITGLYFLPWAIAATRGKSNAGTIGLITWLLGWTVVGWIVALVMACTAHRVLTGPGYVAR
jgi:hypothetical protein